MRASLSVDRRSRLLLSMIGVVIAVFALSTRAVKGEQSDVGAQAGSVSITMTSYQFAPAHIELQRGKSYRLHLVNASGKGHDFSAPALFASSTIAPPDQAKIHDGAVEVDSGSSVDVALVPLVAGDYPLRCTHFLHATFGMRGDVVVN